QEEGQTFHDIQGDLYEHFLAEIATAGKNGQFRTPRHIIEMICALVNPKLGDESSYSSMIQDNCQIS
ncbi:MAG: N-6 DNA methylase, partial [Desulfobulbaceae bacterium]|nr:N-6 DNA methylase [Desulfobulbaceae bacterium]